MMRVSPDDPNHAALEGDVTAFAESHGWILGSATYHTVMPAAVKDVLSRCWDPVALYVRGRSDRIAVKDQRCVMWEAKTNPGKHQRFAIEALPLHHYVRSGVECLYVCRDLSDGFETAFVTTHMPVPDVVFIPDRWTRELKQFFRARFSETWPDVEIAPMGRTLGSSDPFVLFRRDALISKGLDWRAVFTESMQETTASFASASIRNEVAVAPVIHPPVTVELTADDIPW